MARGGPWRAGPNFVPSNAINQIEMWSAATYDRVTIARELDWAGSGSGGLGFNSVRVFLHHIPYHEDRSGFLKRVDDFLGLAAARGLGVLFVLLDGVWDPWPRSGEQRAPLAHVHNSGWAQCPGAAVLADRAQWDGVVGEYVRGVVAAFGNDTRVWGWDLYNEPDNPNHPSYQAYAPPDLAQLSLDLLVATFGWARAAGATQPLTSGVWRGGNWGTPLERAQLELSDVISFHTYGALAEVRRQVQALQAMSPQRPVVCTEYMARPAGSTFDPVLGFLFEQGVGAHHWGFVAGKTQTIYPWDSWCTRYTAEPAVWFHDVLRADGKPFSQAEVDYIKKIMHKAKAQTKDDNH
jgi:hypothetical protein